MAFTESFKPGMIVATAREEDLLASWPTIDLFLTVGWLLACLLVSWLWQRNSVDLVLDGGWRPTGRWLAVRQWMLALPACVTQPFLLLFPALLRVDPQRPAAQ